MKSAVLGLQTTFASRTWNEAKKGTQSRSLFLAWRPSPAPTPPPLLGWVPHSGLRSDLIWFLPISKVALE